jgi:hypothetical protein
VAAVPSDKPPQGRKREKESPRRVFWGFFLSLYVRLLFAIVDALPRVRRAQEIESC